MSTKHQLTYGHLELWDDFHYGLPYSHMFQHVFIFSKTIQKFCTSHGTWWIHPESNKSWSNYTNCLDHKDYKFRNVMNGLMVSGLLISLVFLSVSLIIFGVFKSLRCGRVVLHMNLFLSLICR